MCTSEPRQSSYCVSATAENKVLELIMCRVVCPDCTCDDCCFSDWLAAETNFIRRLMIVLKHPISVLYYIH